MRKLYTGFSNVDGSMVLPGGALIKNGDDLRVVAFPKK